MLAQLVALSHFIVLYSSWNCFFTANYRTTESTHLGNARFRRPAACASPAGARRTKSAESTYFGPSIAHAWGARGRLRAENRTAEQQNHLHNPPRGQSASSKIAKATAKAIAKAIAKAKAQSNSLQQRPQQQRHTALSRRPLGSEHRGRRIIAHGRHTIRLHALAPS